MKRTLWVIERGFFHSPRRILALSDSLGACYLGDRRIIESPSWLTFHPLVSANASVALETFGQRTRTEGFRITICPFHIRRVGRNGCGVCGICCAIVYCLTARVRHRHRNLDWEGSSGQFATYLKWVETSLALAVLCYFS